MNSGSPSPNQRRIRYRSLSYADQIEAHDKSALQSRTLKPSKIEGFYRVEFLPRFLVSHPMNSRTQGHTVDGLKLQFLECSITLSEMTLFRFALSLVKGTLQTSRWGSLSV